MQLLLFVSVSFSIVISACCSLMESALYAVPYPYVKHLAEGGSRMGKTLLELKKDMGRPISAILILNTIANTAGASVAGWAVGKMYDETALAVFSVVFILSILYFSEIIPKFVGVTYCKSVSQAIAIPLSGLVWFFTPLIWVSQGISRYLSEKSDAPRVSHQEVLSMAEIGTAEGSLDTLEGSIIANIIGLDELLVKDVLTPRVVVFRLEEATLLSEIEGSIASWNFSRVPLFAESDPDHLSSYVIQRDVYRELLAGNRDQRLKDLSRNLLTVPELMSVDKLMMQMFEEREHICSVVDEHGALAGIITLEDIIEEVVGREIIDEYDTVTDLRTFARVMRFSKKRGKKK